MNDDLISRAAVIDALDAICERECEYSNPQRAVMCGACRLGSAFDVVDELPSAQPEIVRCRECKFASGNSRICMKFGYGPIGELDFCAWGERKDNDE